LLAIEGARRAPQAAALVNGTVNEALSELREARTLVGHVAQIEAAEFSPDGRSAVTLASDGEVRVWDLATGATVGAFLHARAVRAAFTPGGGRVVSLAADGTARVWRPGSGSPVVVEDVGAHAMSGDARLLLTLGPAEARIWVADTGDTVATVPVATSVLDWIGFSPDGGRVLAIERDGTATAWTTDTGALVARAERAFPDVRLPLFSPDGRAVVALAGAAASVWNVDTASMTALDGAPHDLLSLSFSPDGTRILGLSNDSVIVWDARTGRSRVLCGPDPGDATRADGPRPEASFTQDSQRIVGASCDGTGHVWNADTGEELSILSGHAGDVRFVSASPDGSTVVTSSSGGMMTLWDAATWTQLAVLRGHSGDVRHVRFSPSGDRIVSASTDRTARVWNAVMAFGAPLLEGHQGAVTEVRFDARGQLALTASADGYPRLWDVRTSRLLARLVAKKGLAAPEFSPDGTRAVALCEDGTAVLFDVPGGTPVATLGGESSLCSASAFSPDGSRLVTGSDDGTAHVFDTRDGRHLTRLAGHEGAIHFVGYCAGGARIVTASDDHTARIWDATTGDAIAQTPGHGHEPPIVGPDGSRIVVTLAHGEIRVYDARTGNEVVRLPGRGHAAPTYSADGLRLATEDADGYVRLWDPETAREAGAVRPEEGSRLRAFSPDGTRILTTTRDGAAHLWDAQRGRRVGVVQGSGGPVIDAGFSPDGRWVVLSSFEDTRILDAASAREAWVMTRRHGSVKTVRFSPDGAWLLAGYAGGVARLWPADPLVKARALTPRALTLHEIQKHGVAAPGVVAGVLRIFDDALTNEEIVEIVERRTDLDDPLRQAAIKAALTRDPGVVGEKLRRRAWSVAVRPNGAPEQYASALRWIEVALKLNPSAEDGIATLGAAQFRAGLHHKALATLEGALRKIPASPRSYARVRIALFIAMAHAKLGQPREASTALSDARRTLRELGPSPPEEIRRLLDEATRLIVPEKPPERQ
jgi:WD40 repeat protein